MIKIKILPRKLCVYSEDLVNNQEVNNIYNIINNKTPLLLIIKLGL